MFDEYTTLWLIALLEGNEALHGWRKAMLRRKIRLMENPNFDTYRDYWFTYRCAAAYTEAIENELAYRLHGELLPSGD